MSKPELWWDFTDDGMIRLYSSRAKWLASSRGYFANGMGRLLAVTLDGKPLTLPQPTEPHDDGRTTAAIDQEVS